MTPVLSPGWRVLHINLAAGSPLLPSVNEYSIERANIQPDNTHLTESLSESWGSEIMTSCRLGKSELPFSYGCGCSDRHNINIVDGVQPSRSLIYLQIQTVPLGVRYCRISSNSPILRSRPVFFL